MATIGPLSPSTIVDSDDVGTVAWATPENAGVSDDVYATFSAGTTNIQENSARIVKGGIISGNEKSTSTGMSTATAIHQRGGANDLWGLAWISSDINATDFGFVHSWLGFGTNVSHYLKATNFGFSIPTGAIINGILVEVETDRISSTGRIDHIRITVYYKEAKVSAPPSQIQSTPELSTTNIPVMARLAGVKFNERPYQ